MAPRDKLLRAGLQCRQGRQPQGRHAIACKTAAGALRTAERLALSKLGVVAFSSTGDPEMGDYDDEPTVIFPQWPVSSGLRLKTDKLRSPLRAPTKLSSSLRKQGPP